MKFWITLILILFSITANATVMEGGVSKTGAMNMVVDSQTNMPVPNAKISLPKQNFTTYTDDYGTFNLNANIKDFTIMSVEKDGYRPFSITVNEKTASAPLILGIEKSNVQDIIISSEMFHLGDDNFSSASANSDEFKGKSIGPFYTKTFSLTANTLKETNYLIIGSIIGIDTLLARSMRQNSIVNSFSSPPEVFLNGSKIAEIKLNGDGQKVKLPHNLIRNGENEITIKTGRNLKQTAYIDYDDIELMNLSIQSE